MKPFDYKPIKKNLCFVCKPLFISETLEVKPPEDKSETNLNFFYSRVQGTQVEH